MTPEDREQAPRIHAITCGHCATRIVRFDLPTTAPQLLAQDAVNRGWQLGRDGKWACEQHLETE